jgi:hypothetical protein
MLGMVFMMLVDCVMAAACCQRKPKQMVWVDSAGKRIEPPRAPEGAKAMRLEDFQADAKKHT